MQWCVSIHIVSSLSYVLADTDAVRNAAYRFVTMFAVSKSLIVVC